MPQLTSKDLAKRLSHRLAGHKVKDEDINKLAQSIIVEGMSIKKFDICAYGICFDIFTERLPKVDELFTKFNFSRLEVFPYGILNPDQFHVRVAVAIDGLEGLGVGAGLGR